jgi:hypothetical protein
MRRCHLAVAGAALSLLFACSFVPSGSGPGGRDDAGGAGADGGPTIDAATPDAAIVCTAGAKLCTGRNLRTCNETGTGFLADGDTLCPFTCEVDRCTAASNIPELDQTMCTTPALALTPPAGANVTITAAGQIECTPSCGGVNQIPAVGDIAQGGGALPLRWFCLSELALPADVTITAEPAVARSIALVVNGNALIAGKIELKGGNGSATTAGTGGSGGFAGAPLVANASPGQPGSGPCAGGGGGRTTQGGQTNVGGGGAGGSFGGKGGAGGSGKNTGNQTAAGGTAQNPCGAAALVPLIGGSGGGGGGDGSGPDTDSGWPGGGGGGAFQLSVRGTLTLSSGSIDLRGGDGFGSTSGDDGNGGGGGGGAGGGVLLEAPTVVFGTTSIELRGGRGGQADAGGGGNGATGANLNGSNGTDAALQTGEGGSGGGGGGGRLRINSLSGATCSGVQVSPTASCTSGTVANASSIGG